MKDLSSSLLALYEAAERVPANAFVQDAIRLLCLKFHYDAATLRAEYHSNGAHADAVIDHSFVREDDQAALETCEQGELHDIGARNLVLSLREPLRCDTQSLLGRERLPAMDAFVRRHGLRHLMLFGGAVDRGRMLWIAMYRRAVEGFSRHESDALLALWPHIARCVQINRSRHLEGQLRHLESRAAALVSRHGTVEAADPRFCELLENEWPLLPNNRLAEPVLNCLRAGHDYEGKRIRIALCGQEDLILCKAFDKNLLSTLTPAELAVAREFSRGLTHKAVALHLGVSENTVRSHIKHVYDKLSIHNKARLVQLMAATHLR